MNEHFLDYTQSLAVKELGFDEATICVYNSYGHLKGVISSSVDGDYIKKEKWEDRLPAPLKSHFFKWVRDKGYKPNIVNDVSASKDGFYYFDIWLSGQILWETDYIFETYEQAEDACINKIIELIKLK